MPHLAMIFKCRCEVRLSLIAVAAPAGADPPQYLSIHTPIPIIIGLALKDTKPSGTRGTDDFSGVD